MDKKNRLSTDYDDEDMDWLDDDDDYLDDGGLLSSLLFGDKKKKKKNRRDTSDRDDRQRKETPDETVSSKSSSRHEDRQVRPDAGRTKAQRSGTGRVERTAPERAGRTVRQAASDAARPVRSSAGHAGVAAGATAKRSANTQRSVAESGRAVRPATEQTRPRPSRRPAETSVQSDAIENNVYRDETAASENRSVRRRKVSSDRTPVRLEGEKKKSPVRSQAASAGTVDEYDEYYHENSRSRKMRDERAESRQNSAGMQTRRTRNNLKDADRTGTSVDNLLREVSNLEEDSRQRHEDLRREAWERTQRNVAKAKAEVERLEFEREQNEKEEARKRRVQEEMQRRQAEAEKKRLEQEAEKPEEEHNVPDEMSVDMSQQTDGAQHPDAPADEDAEVKDTDTVSEDIQNDSGEENAPEESDSEESAKEDEDDLVEDDKAAGNHSEKDMLDMDALERIERDIDEDKLKYSESDTEDLALGDIGRALGFDAVELEDDEEEPEDDEESDSEKFFRENLLDEADPKVVNPERKKLNISTKVWAIAFFVLLALFILICVIYVKNYARMKYNEMNINEISADQLLVNDGVKDATSGYRTIALYGVDSRDQNMDAGTNSDSIMLVSINESTNEIKLVSVYRDTLMDIASGAMSESQKVNYAYQLGGAVTAINTLNTNLDLNITDYVAVDFSAMASIIDAVGGVDVNVVDDEINNFNKNLAEQISISGKYSSGITQAGQYTLDGQQAVAYSRIRSTGSGDITRTERQRIVLMKVIDKLINADTGSLSTFVDVSFNNISTSLNKDDILNLVKDVAKYKVTDTAGFPFSYAAVNMADKGSCLVAADMETNVQALHEYLYGTTHYKVSNTSKQVSANLEKETGVSAQKVKIETEKPGDGISDGKEEGDLRTITEPPKGMILDE